MQFVGVYGTVLTSLLLAAEGAGSPCEIEISSKLLRFRSVTPLSNLSRGRRRRRKSSVSRSLIDEKFGAPVIMAASTDKSNAVN